MKYQVYYTDTKGNWTPTNLGLFENREDAEISASHWAEGFYSTKGHTPLLDVVREEEVSPSIPPCRKEIDSLIVKIEQISELLQTPYREDVLYCTRRICDLLAGETPLPLVE